MAVTYSCDRCGFKTTREGEVLHYTVEIASGEPIKSCEVDLCEKCIDTVWKNIREQMFRADRQPTP